MESLSSLDTLSSEMESSEAEEADSQAEAEENKTPDSTATDTLE